MNEKKENLEMTAIRLKPELLAALREIARDDDRELAWVLRKAVEEYVQRNYRLIGSTVSLAKTPKPARK